MFVTKKKYLKLKQELFDTEAELYITSTILSQAHKKIEELSKTKKPVAKKATVKKADK